MLPAILIFGTAVFVLYLGISLLLDRRARARERLRLPDLDAREAILRLNTARMPTVGVDVTALAAATDGLSGADLKALCQQAAIEAMVRVRDEGGDGSEAASAVLSVDFRRPLERRAANEGHHG